MAHYLMVAKLSNRCFALVERIAESREKKVTQSDFLDLYKKKQKRTNTISCSTYWKGEELSKGSESLGYVL